MQKEKLNDFLHTNVSPGYRLIHSGKRLLICNTYTKIHYPNCLGTEKERVYDPERDLLLNIMTKVEPEVDEVESDGRRRVDGKEAIGGEWGDGETASPSYSALRPPRLHDDELDLTSFDSSMAATNASLPTFVESPNGDKVSSRSTFPSSDQLVTLTFDLRTFLVSREFNDS